MYIIGDNSPLKSIHNILKRKTRNGNEVGKFILKIIELLVVWSRLVARLVSVFKPFLDLVGPKSILLPQESVVTYVMCFGAMEGINSQQPKTT